MLIRSRLTQNIDIPDNQRLVSNGLYILGDSGYPLHPWLLTPFNNKGGHVISHKEKTFNYHLSSARVIVEQAFGRLKMRWRRLLGYIDSHDINMINTIIMSGFTLHNFCEKLKEILKYETGEEPVEIELETYNIDEETDEIRYNT